MIRDTQYIKNMDLENFDKIIDKVKKQHPVWFERSLDNERISLDEIAHIENMKEVCFPLQYKRFIIEYGVGEFAFTTVYSPLLEGEWSLWKQQMHDSLPQEFIPVSDNSCGDYLGFIVQRGTCSDQLYWIDHERGYSIEIAEYAFMTLSLKQVSSFMIRNGLSQTNRRFIVLSMKG